MINKQQPALCVCWPMCFNGGFPSLFSSPFKQFAMLLQGAEAHTSLCGSSLEYNKSRLHRKAVIVNLYAPGNDPANRQHKQSSQSHRTNCRPESHKSGKTIGLDIRRLELWHWGCSKHECFHSRFCSMLTHERSLFLQQCGVVKSFVVCPDPLLCQMAKEFRCIKCITH